MRPLFGLERSLVVDKNTCKKCCFFEENASVVNGWGRCCKYPPVVLMQIVSGDYGQTSEPMTYWPQVYKDEVCGEFQSE